MKRNIILIIVILIGVLVFAALPRQEEPVQARLVGLDAGAGDYRRAEPGGMIAFPEAFAPQPDFATEWWYYTGNLSTVEGREFGYQLTFFRRALVGMDERSTRESGWGADQVYMAHFTLTDVTGQRFRFFERFSRGAAGLAGAGIQPSFEVWLEDWRVEQSGEDTYRLRAGEGEARLELTLTDRKGPVLQGQAGYSQKGADPGNASYYFSQPRLESIGTVEVGGTRFSVTGWSWMDREISTSALSQEEVGWDWFAMQLSDGSDLMLYNLRRKDGSLSPFSSGTLVRPDGSTRTLSREEFKITPTGTWRSPHSQAVYPAGWLVEIPSEGMRLEVRPKLADQELRVSFIYWEGAVAVSGERQGQAVTGSGYVELTGYDRPLGGEV